MRGSYQAYDPNRQAGERNSRAVPSARPSPGTLCSVIFWEFFQKSGALIGYIMYDIGHMVYGM